MVVVMGVKGFDGLSHEQRKQLLEWFMCRLDMPTREQLGATLPAAYNAWCGGSVVQVVSADDASRVWSVTS